jgi:hypothetical protein
VQERGQAGWSPAVDPWATQAALVWAQHRLQMAQQAERGLVNTGYEQVARLERHRMACWRSLVECLLEQYGRLYDSTASAQRGRPDNGPTPLERLQGAALGTPSHAIFGSGTVGILALATLVLVALLPFGLATVGILGLAPSVVCGLSVKCSEALDGNIKSQTKTI